MSNTTREMLIGEASVRGARALCHPPCETVYDDPSKWCDRCVLRGIADRPILHERAESGAWICCCGDHLSGHRKPDGWISPVSVARLRDDATDDLTGVEVVKGRYRKHWRPVFIGPLQETTDDE